MDRIEILFSLIFKSYLLLIFYWNILCLADTICDQPTIEQISAAPHVSKLDFTVENVTTNDVKHSYQLSVTGVDHKSKGFMTIGISSVRRINGADYLLQTLASLIDHMTTADQSEVIIVVFLADTDTNYNNDSARVILSQYSRYVDSGLIRILQVSADYYPKLDGLKRNFGDSPDRVKWRAKQVADFVLLFTYCRNISHYYLQLEDDVEASRDFVTAIRRYIEAVDGHWMTLEFSELGFIGKLFHSSDLDSLISFMWMFYVEQPVDWLLSYFRLSVGQREILLRKPTLFQHIGTKSSFDLSKDNPLKDRYYDAGDGVWSGADNPPAAVTSTMPHFKEHLPEMAYSSGNGFFWATKCSAGDSIHVVFTETQNVSRIVIVTGSNNNPTDLLDNGSVYISNNVVNHNNSTKHSASLCSDKGQRVAVFNNGQAIADHIENVVSSRTRCIRVTVDSDQTHWVLFAHIAVFTVH